MFFLSILIIIILELLDSSLRTPTIFQKETQLNRVVYVGKIDLEKKPLGDYFDFKTGATGNRIQSRLLKIYGNFGMKLKKAEKKLFFLQAPKHRKGKQPLLNPLAHTFSMSRKKILLIDANFSNNSLTRDFSAKPALETFSMTGQQEMEKDTGTSQRRPVFSQVDIIGCDEGNYTPSEILPEVNLLNNLDKLTTSV